jgi:hypothetical protein
MTAETASPETVSAAASADIVSSNAGKQMMRYFVSQLFDFH